MVTNNHNILQAPVITSHPQSDEILLGYHVVLEVTAYGAMPLYYQWYYENDIVPGMYVIIILCNNQLPFHR